MTPESSYLPARLIAASGVSIAAAVVILLSFSWVRAKAWQRTAREKIAQDPNSKESSRSVLMACVRGNRYRLGNLEFFKSAYIGKDSRNTVSIDDPGVAGRHLRVVRKGKTIYVRNLAEKPFWVNAKQLLPKRQTKVSVPANIQLADQVSLQLLVIHEKIEKKENKDAAAKEKQLRNNA